MKSITGNEGLSDLLVNTIYKDSEGYMWFGTESAVDRFDGNSIVSWPLPGNAAGKSRVNAILRVPSGDVFVGSQAGLFRLLPDMSGPEQVFPDKITFPVNALAADGSNRLFVATDRGVYEYAVSSGKLTRLPLGDDRLKSDNRFSDILKAGTCLYALTGKTLYKYNLWDDKSESFALPSGAQSGKMTVLGDILYLSVNGEGVFPFDMPRVRFGDRISFGDNLIMALSSGDGNLYVAVDGEGIYRYSPESGKIEGHLSTSEGEPRLKSNSVYSVLSDSNGQLWVGYYQIGVDYTPNFNDFFSTYSIPKASFSTAGLAVRSLAIEGDFKVIGTREGLFLVDEKSARVTHFKKPQLRSNIIFCIKSMGSGRFLVGTYNGGMYELDANSGRISDFSLDGTLKLTSSVFAIESDHDGNLWIGTSEGLLRAKDGRKTGEWTFTNSQLPEGNVYEIFFDSAGRGWICTENGMALWDGNTLRADRFPSDFIHKQKIRDIFEDSAHNLYFIPDRGKVFRSDIKISKYGPVNLGGDGNIVAFFGIEDNDGHLWFGTDKGVIRYDKKDNYHHFSIADGIPGQIFTLCPSVKDSAGNLFMGNTSGLAVLDYKEFLAKDSVSHKPLVVSNVLSDGSCIMSRVKREGKQYSVSLSGKESDLTVYVTDFSYRLSQYFVAEYMLEGVDSEWHPVDGTKPITLYDIPAGRHKLHIRLQDDPRSETVLEVYRASAGWVGVAIVLVIIAGGGCAWYAYRRRRLRVEAEAVGNPQEAGDVAAEEEAPAEKTRSSYKTTRLSDEECKRLLKMLDKIMANDKPYRNPDLKSSELAAFAGTTSHALSFLFNQYLNKSYYDYVNEFRVEEFKRLVAETDISRYTMTALSEKCGFSSRASFFRHFKAVTGITPAEYIKSK